jgi:hypothetical protein
MAPSTLSSCTRAAGSASSPFRSTHACRAFQRHSTPNGGVDGAAARGSVSLGYCTSLPDPRSGFDLRTGGPRTHSRDGHRGSRDRAEEPLAIAIRGTADRQHPPRLLGPRHRAQREAPETAPRELHRELLPPGSNTPVARQGLPAAEARATAEMGTIVEFLRWVGYTTATSVERPDPAGTTSLMRIHRRHQSAPSRAGTSDRPRAHVDDRPPRYGSRPTRRTSSGCCPYPPDGFWQGTTEWRTAVVRDQRPFVR